MRAAPADLSVLKELIEAEKVRAVTDRRYSLDQIREDHRYAEAGPGYLNLDRSSGFGDQHAVDAGFL